MIKDLLANIDAKNELVEWRLYSNESLIDSFDINNWKRIFSDITDVHGLNKFLAYECGQCYVAYNLTTNVPFGFIYAYIEDEKNNKVSLHGGGWRSGNTLLNYNAYILLIDTMLEKGIKVRTACELENETAMRFNRSIGFIKYYSSKNYHYLWISKERLRKSKIYKRINSNFKKEQAENPIKSRHN